MTERANSMTQPRQSLFLLLFLVGGCTATHENTGSTRSLSGASGLETVWIEALGME